MRQVAEAQEALDLQRRELSRQYEENLLKQETETQLRLDEATARTFGAEQECKKLVSCAAAWQAQPCLRLDFKLLEIMFTSHVFGSTLGRFNIVTDHHES